MTGLLLWLAKLPASVKLGTAVLLVGTVAMLAYGAHERNVGRNEILASVLARKQTVDSIRVVQLDTVVRVDTVRLARATTHYETLHDSVFSRLTDTLFIKAEIAAADTVIRSCRIALSDALTACQARDTLIATLRQQVALRLPPSSGGASWKERAGWALVGGAVVYAVHR